MRWTRKTDEGGSSYPGGDACPVRLFAEGLDRRLRARPNLSAHGQWSRSRHDRSAEDQRGRRRQYRRQRHDGPHHRRCERQRHSRHCDPLANQPRRSDLDLPSARRQMVRRRSGDGRRLRFWPPPPARSQDRGRIWLPALFHPGRSGGERGQGPAGGSGRHGARCAHATDQAPAPCALPAAADQAPDHVSRAAPHR